MPLDVTWEYVHLITNPFPVVLTTAGVGVGLAGWATGRDDLERWGVLSLVLAAVLSVPTYFTGLTAADVAGQRTFTRPDLMQTHRVWATWTIVALVADGVFAAFSLFQPDDRRLRRFVLIVGALVVPLLFYAAFLGGRINHAPAEEAPDRTASVRTESAPAQSAPDAGADLVIRRTSPPPEPMP